MQAKPVQISMGGYTEANPEDKFKAKNNPKNNIKKMYAIVSGKGGVGKSSITSMFADASNKMGYKTAIMDADITGPSIPKIFGVDGKLEASEAGVYPAKSKGGLSLMSINLLLEDTDSPVVWRGPILGGVIKQFYEEVIWGDVDYMFVDMPPGTGDVPLTVFQSLPIDGIIMISSPQNLSGMIVAKAINMAKMMNVPMIGLLENMSYFTCPDNNKDYNIFGESHIEELAKKYELPVLGKLPINPEITKLCDEGCLEDIVENPLVSILKNVIK